MPHVLDNAGWHALIGAHAAFAEGGGRARRYRTDVSVFHAAEDDAPASWEALVPLASDGMVVLFRAEPITVPDGWRRSFGGEGIQMVLDGPLGVVPTVPSRDGATGRAVTMRALGDGDVDAMLGLVALTEPGPFRPRTHELGGYVGIFHDDELVAMAGRRLRPPGYCEVSAVCTHPAARRRGYASIVTARVAEGIIAEGEVPFLHVATTNTTAIPVYEQLGFARRRLVTFGGFRTP